MCVSSCRVHLDSQEIQDSQAAQVLQVHRWVIRPMAPTSEKMKPDYTLNVTVRQLWSIMLCRSSLVQLGSETGSRRIKQTVLILELRTYFKVYIHVVSAGSQRGQRSAWTERNPWPSWTSGQYINSTFTPLHQQYSNSTDLRPADSLIC